MALARGGEAIDNPQAWFDSLPDSVVAFWQAYWKVEPWGNWIQHAQLCNTIDNIRVALTSGKAEDLKDFGHWMPPDWDKPETPEMDVGQTMRAMAAHYGKA